MNINKQTFTQIIFISVLIITAFISGFFAVTVYASTNIDATSPHHFAWSSVIGWINFRATNSVNVTPTGIDGFARFGPEGGPFNFLSLDCASGPPGSSCAIPYEVTNDGNGNLAGFAWSDAIGWVSFNCNNSGTGGIPPDHSCVNSQYRVRIDSNGNFTGWAWNDVIGWISFNCNQAEGNQCASVDYRVRTAWTPGPVRGILESGTFDTNRPAGAAFNYLVWRGTLNGGRVSFQFATSNCANGATDPTTIGDGIACNENIGWGGAKTGGDGAFLGPSGGTTQEDVYILNPNIAIEIRNPEIHNNRRFFRYRTILETDAMRTGTPIVEDVVVNWSP